MIIVESKGKKQETILKFPGKTKNARTNKDFANHLELVQRVARIHNSPKSPTASDQFRHQWASFSDE